MHTHAHPRTVAAHELLSLIDVVQIYDPGSNSIAAGGFMQFPR